MTTLPATSIPAIQEQILEWEKELPSEQEKHWNLQWRGMFNRELYERVKAAKIKINNKKFNT